MVRSRVHLSAFVAAWVAAAGCTSEVRIRVSIDGVDATSLDTLRVRVGDRIGTTESRDSLDVLVADDLAGTEATVEIWGLRGDDQVAYGKASVTPSESTTVELTVALASVTCGAWCEPGQSCASGTCVQAADGCTTCEVVTTSCSSSADCDETKLPECISGSTLRMYGEGACNNNACSYSYLDATCTLGCTDGACRPSVAAGGDNSCALRANGSLVCWGGMELTQLPTASFRSIDIKRYHGCGITTSGAPDCWAKDTFGNTWGELDIPPSTTFSAIAAGDGFSCGIIASTKTLDCWGDTIDNQTAAPTGAFSLMGLGIDHGCALRDDRTAACWGRNMEQQQAPVPGGTFTRIAAGRTFSCGIRDGGALECWGQIEAPPPGVFVDLSAGFDHACAVRSDGFIECWGSNANQKATPLAGSYSNVSAGDQHTCAVRLDGTIACWGDPSQGATDVPTGL